MMKTAKVRVLGLSAKSVQNPSQISAKLKPMKTAHKHNQASHFLSFSHASGKITIQNDQREPPKHNQANTDFTFFFHLFLHLP